jgi:hypothetical protein
MYAWLFCVEACCPPVAVVLYIVGRSQKQHRPDSCFSLSPPVMKIDPLVGRLEKKNMRGSGNHSNNTGKCLHSTLKLLYVLMVLNWVFEWLDLCDLFLVQKNTFNAIPY